MCFYQSHIIYIKEGTEEENNLEFDILREHKQARKYNNSVWFGFFVLMTYQLCRLFNAKASCLEEQW